VTVGGGDEDVACSLFLSETGGRTKKDQGALQQKTRRMAGCIQNNPEHLAPFFHEGSAQAQGSGG
jgi:hypothetical protein